MQTKIAGSASIVEVITFKAIIVFTWQQLQMQKGEQVWQS
jgi:hypothetical protein